MNWTQFLIGLSAIYGIYYAMNLLFDLFIHRGAQTKGDGINELVFSDEPTPERVIPDPFMPERQPITNGEKSVISSGPLQSTGGINLKELVSLVQNDLIEYTKAIPY